ncbi:MAG: PBSX family phage terminase large subunit [Methanobrevibacter sp.]|nr:PBSX family phage terminase large subunit [Methanobrevibacter sp.]
MKKAGRNTSKKLKNNEYFHYGDWGKTALNFLFTSDAWINIATGSVRSGKTVACNARWIEFLQNSKSDEFLISGKSSQSLRRNVIRPLIKMLNTEGIDYDYHKRDGELEIEDKLCYVMGFNDEKAVDVIAGMSVGGWYADEIARCPKSAVEMAISRCSDIGAKMFWNTNPDSPYHFIYENYINNKELLKAGTVKTWKFLIDDNPNLDPHYVTELKRVNQKSEVFYKRNILGEWVIAEGAIYDMFSPKKHVFNKIPFNIHEMNICCDYGVSTVTTFGVMGIHKDEELGNSYALLEETYYDKEVEGVAQSDSERVNDIVKLQDKYKLNENNTVYLPHDAASLKAECEKDSRLKMRVETYAPNTFEDITTIQNLFSTDKFFIHEDCTNSISQAQTYSWDKKAQQRGEDRPLKENDHCCDMWRGGILGPRNKRDPSLEIIEL